MAKRSGRWGIWAALSGVGLAAAGLVTGLAVRASRQLTADSEQLELQPQPGRTITADDGVPLYAEVSDPAVPAQVTVILVHGLVLNLHCWHYQQAFLREHADEWRARIVSYDQRGHGQSGAAPPNTYQIKQLAADLESVITATATEKVILIGHSMGAMAIMELARRRPNWFGKRIIGAALISTAAADVRGPLLQFVPRPVYSRLAPGALDLAGRIPLAEQLRAAVVGPLLIKIIGFGRPDVSASQVRFARQLAGATPLPEVLAFTKAVTEFDATTALGPLSRIPTLVVGGAKDHVTGPGHTKRLQQLLPEAMSTILPGCGHLGILECHSEINELLRVLIDQTLNPAGS